jgi:hypothetical protein
MAVTSLNLLPAYIFRLITAMLCNGPLPQVV